MKIIETLPNNKYIVELLPVDKQALTPSLLTVMVVHDYVKFISTDWVNNETNEIVTFKTEVSIDIRDIIKLVIPFLKNHKYFQKPHLKDRVHSKDDTYFKNYGLTEPTYKKGEKYPAYAHTGFAMKYWDGNTAKVKFRRTGESSYSTVTFEVWELIKDKVKLNLNTHDYSNHP
jgi:hypothetical protein